MPYVARRGVMMFGIESDQNLRIAGANRSVGTVGLVDAGVGQTDVVENRLEFIVRNLLPQNALDFVAEPRCLFHAQAGTPAYVQAQLARVHLREEVLSQEREQPEREQAKSQEANHEHSAILERGFEQLLVAPAEVFKLVFEATLEAAEERLGSFGAMLVTAHDEHDQGWDGSSRQQITGQHGEAHGLRQRYEQEFRHTRQEEHGHKHDADAEGGDKRRYGDLLGAVEDGLLHLLAHGKVALDVFDFHRGIIDQEADGGPQPPRGLD